MLPVIPVIVGAVIGAAVTHQIEKKCNGSSLSDKLRKGVKRIEKFNNEVVETLKNADNEMDGIKEVCKKATEKLADGAASAKEACEKAIEKVQREKLIDKTLDKLHNVRTKFYKDMKKIFLSKEDADAPEDNLTSIPVSDLSEEATPTESTDHEKAKS